MYAKKNKDKYRRILFYQLRNRFIFLQAHLSIEHDQLLIGHFIQLRHGSESKRKLLAM